MNRPPKEPLRATIPASNPLNATLGLDAAVVDEEAQSAGSIAIQKGHDQRLYQRQRVLNSDTAQSSPANGDRHTTKADVCRNGIPNSTIEGRRGWIAALMKRHWLQHLPLGRGPQSIS